MLVAHIDLEDEWTDEKDSSVFAAIDLIFDTVETVHPGVDIDLVGGQTHGWLQFSVPLESQITSGWLSDTVGNSFAYYDLPGVVYTTIVDLESEWV